MDKSGDLGISPRYSAFRIESRENLLFVIEFASANCRCESILLKYQVKIGDQQIIQPI